MSGWNRLIFALFLGAISALSFPPLFFLPLLIPGFVGLLWLIGGSSANSRQGGLKVIRKADWSAFVVGWFFGLGYFSVGLYWVTYSFLVDAQTFAWMIPIVFFVLVGGMAIYTGLTSWATHKFSDDGLGRIIALATWWVLFEWVRSWAFSGFPWNLLGTVWTFSAPMIQLAAVTGVFGLSLVTVLCATVTAVLAETTLNVRHRWQIMLTGLGVLLLLWIGGSIRLGYSTDGDVKGVQLRLIQPNIAQKDKWKPDLLSGHLNSLLNLSKLPNKINDSNRTHIIWPETAVPFFIDSHSELLSVLGEVAPADGALITGAPRKTKHETGPSKLWNSIYVIDSLSRVVDKYDKNRLVPFGEYIPFRSYLNFSSIAAGRKDFSSGGRHKLLQVPGAPIMVPLICYEAIFPHRTNFKIDSDRPGWLLNVTNDAWFGSSSGPYQHFASVQMRSVEEGIPVVRVANTGITGVIDPYGRIRFKTKLNTRTIVDSTLPKSLGDITWYVKYGNSTLFIILAILFLVSKQWKGRRLDKNSFLI
ncbi:MAG: apolipoprotein N-acyltransferase [Pseudomonadota bacterium]|nr:apolipoprotein N-acyltransferase [Pseudomonadota bacterium]